MPPKDRTVPPADSWICIRDYEEFFGSLNLLSVGLEDVDSARRAGDIASAFTAYRKALFDRLERLDVTPLDPRRDDPIAAADELLDNRVSLLGTEPVDIGSPIDWFATPGGDKQWQSHLGYFYFANCLVTAYLETEKRGYLDKWMAVLTDFFAFHPLGVEGLEWSRTEPMYRNELAYGCGGEGRYPGYAGGSWLGLSCGRVEWWISALAELGNDPAMPDAFLANVLVSIMRDHATVMLNNPRRYTPNQFYHVALVLTSLGVVFPEFNVSAACYLVGVDRLETSMRTTALADGSDMEQSFNYNSGLPGRFYELYRMYRDDPTPRIGELLEVVERRCRFLAAMTTPLGTWPQIAKTHADDVRPKLSEWAELFGLDDVATLATSVAGEEAADMTAATEGNPAGTTPPEHPDRYRMPSAPSESLGSGSVAFPCGGYYVLRSGLSRRDAYLLLKGSRLAIGHMHEDCCSLVLFAHGRRLLVDSGNFNYADDPESRRKNRYFFSSMSHNTVTVDGLSQGRLVLQGSTDLTELDRPIDARTYRWDTAEIVEGIYAEGYTAATPHPPSDQEIRLAGRHRRTICWIKPDVWVVVDRLEIEGQIDAGPIARHHYSARWQLAPGFAAEVVEVSESPTRIRTVDPEGANITIGCSRECATRMVSGSDDPYEGWVATHYNEAVPAVDVSCTWQDGNATAAVHIIAARPDEADAVESLESVPQGLRAALCDGRLVTAVAAEGERTVTIEHDGTRYEGAVVINVAGSGGASESGRMETIVLDVEAGCAAALGKPDCRDIRVIGDRVVALA